MPLSLCRASDLRTHFHEISGFSIIGLSDCDDLSSKPYLMNSGPLPVGSFVLAKIAKVQMTFNESSVLHDNRINRQTQFA